MAVTGNEKNEIFEKIAASGVLSRQHDEATGGQTTHELLEKLLLEELQEKRREKQVEAETQENNRRIKFEEIRKITEAKRQQQAGCSHVKPNGWPNIGGQRDHRGTYHFICSYCMKEWTEKEIPAHLASRINMELVGGPNM